MYVSEADVGCAENTNWELYVFVYFALLAFQALGNLVSDVRVHIGPYKVIGDELTVARLLG